MIEHIHLENFIGIVGHLQNTIVSIVIQINPDGALVSKSGYESAFDEIAKHMQECDEERLVIEMQSIHFGCMGRTEYALPNKKSFVRLDFTRGE